MGAMVSGSGEGQARCSYRGRCNIGEDIIFEPCVVCGEPAEAAIHDGEGRVWRTYRHADDTPIMGEYSFLTETDYWDNEVDDDYVEVVEETWQLVSTRVLKYGRTDTWCVKCDEEFVLPEPKPWPHYCAACGDTIDLAASGPPQAPGTPPGALTS